MQRLNDHVEREIDGLALTYPTRTELRADYVPREEHHQHTLDRRSRVMLGVAIASVLASPFLSALAQLVLAHPR